MSDHQNAMLMQEHLDGMALANARCAALSLTMARFAQVRDND